MKEFRSTTNIDELGPAPSVADQAALWWLVLNEPGCTAAEQQAFTRWLAKSPERVEAYMRVTLLKRTLDVDTAWPKVSAEQLIAAARQSAGDVVTLPMADSNSASTSDDGASVRADAARACAQAASAQHLDRPVYVAGRVRSRPLPSLIALAATLLVAIGAVTWYAAGIGQYSTEFGEQRSVVLSDGSLVTLNTASTIKVAFDERKRTVHLLRGEALFRVAHDERLPFEVVADDTTIRAVGTQFNVDRREHRTAVTVVEGKVLVAASSQKLGKTGEVAPLMAGEQIIVAAGRVESPKPVNVLAATAWTKRRLIFEQRPLGEVAEEFGRYNRERILIEDPDLRRQEVTGDFDADRIESFIAFLSRIPGVSVDRDRRGTYVVTSEEPQRR